MHGIWKGDKENYDQNPFFTEALTSFEWTTNMSLKIAACLTKEQNYSTNNNDDDKKVSNDALCSISCCVFVLAMTVST